MSNHESEGRRALGAPLLAQRSLGPLSGRSRYPVVILAYTHAVLVDELTPEVAGEPDERRAQRGECQGRTVRLEILAEQKARYVARDEVRVVEPVVGGQPADGPVLYLVVVQYPGGGGAHRSHQAED